MASAYFAPLVTLPTIIDGPGKYETRVGEIIEVYSVPTSSVHAFACRGIYTSGIADRWHKSGRLYAGVVSDNDIVSKWS